MPKTIKGNAGRKPPEPSASKLAARQAGSDGARRSPPGSTAVLPVPDICLTALKLRAERQADDRNRATDAWQGSELVFTRNALKRLGRKLDG